jgi:multidrug efflux system membrane fusion protein
MRAIHLTSCSSQRSRVAPAVGLVLAALAAGLSACGEAKQPQPVAAPPRVTVAKPTLRTIVDQDEYVGRFVAVDSVEIRARVSGYLEKVHFQDGQHVNQGDILFTIDKRSFQNTVAQATANLETAKSNLAFAEADLARGQQLMRERTISEQVFQQRSQMFRNAQAAVAANEAMLRQAALDLEFTELRAPVSGRIGDRRVTPGNLVTGGTGGTTLLANIVSTDPIRLEFTFDEASLLRYERLAKGGHKDVTGRGDTSVRAKLIDEPDFSHQGRMDFIDNVVDRATGTIRARAQFSNAAGLFTPGMFARVQVPGSSPYQALLLPDAAIGTEQSKKYVLSVNAENIVVQKYVSMGDMVDGLRVIKTGIAPEDMIIVNGLIAARLGAKVTPQEERGPPQASAPAARKE